MVDVLADGVAHETNARRLREKALRLRVSGGGAEAFVNLPLSVRLTLIKWYGTCLCAAVAGAGRTTVTGEVATGAEDQREQRVVRVQVHGSNV